MHSLIKVAFLVALITATVSANDFLESRRALGAVQFGPDFQNEQNAFIARQANMTNSTCFNKNVSQCLGISTCSFCFNQTAGSNSTTGQCLETVDYLFLYKYFDVKQCIQAANQEPTNSTNRTCNQIWQQSECLANNQCFYCDNVPAGQTTASGCYSQSDQQYFRQFVPSVQCRQGANNQNTTKNTTNNTNSTNNSSNNTQQNNTQNTTVVVCKTPVATVGQVISLSSSVDGSFYLVNKNGDVFNDRLSSSLLREASFRVVPALNKRAGYISFQSISQPNSYLRHQNYLIKLHRFENVQLYLDDSSFRVIPALNGNCSQVSLESSNYPGYLIAPQNQRNMILRFQNSSELINGASWNLRAAVQDTTNGGFCDNGVWTNKTKKVWRYNILQGAAIMGYDIGNRALRVNLQQCIAECDKNDDCFGFDFRPKSNECWLSTLSINMAKRLNVFRAAGSIPDLINYDKVLNEYSYAILRDTAQMGYDMRRYDNIPVEDCIEFCNVRDNCYGFDYSSYRSCWPTYISQEQANKIGGVYRSMKGILNYERKLVKDNKDTVFDC